MELQHQYEELERAAENNVVARIRCGKWLPESGRVCNRVLDKICPHARKPTMVSLWGNGGYVSEPSGRATLHKPEIRRPLDIAPGEFGEERRRWICKCGSSYTIRMDRLMAAFVKYAPNVEHDVFELRFGIEL